MAEGLFSSLYNQGQPFALIDTRERREHVNGHWFGSTNIPLSVLSNQIRKLVPAVDFPIHLLDWQDAAANAAAWQLTELGYHNVTRCLTQHPEQFGHGFVKGEFVWSKAFGEVLAHTCGLPEITPEEYLAHHQNARLFDVRPTAEYSQFTIPGSQSLPNSQLLANLNTLEQTGEKALLHCAGRTRSIIGACTLKAAGYPGPYAIFKGGTQAWQLDGQEREFNADRLFARESSNTQSIKLFLDKWSIHYQHINNTELESYVSKHSQAHMFDVSDDAATGQIADHQIIRISGTNLIQQTDRSIARYHVPVILFDQGSGSRAAFAAYWLQTMGFNVGVVYLSKQVPDLPTKAQNNPVPDAACPVLSTEQLLQHHDSGNSVLDFRPSTAYNHSHLADSNWQNTSELLAIDTQRSEPIIVIGSNIAHASDTANLLHQHGWQVTGIYAWDNNTIDSAHLTSGTVDTPVDQSALFAGRHHGNMQDSRDYLAWEEALPEQIDQTLHQQWLERLSAENTH